MSLASKICQVVLCKTVVSYPPTLCTRRFISSRMMTSGFPWNPNKLAHIDSFVCASEDLTQVVRAAYNGDLHYVKEQLPTAQEPVSVFETLAEACMGGQSHVVEYVLSLYPPSDWTSCSARRTSLNPDPDLDPVYDVPYPKSLARKIIASNKGEIVRCFIGHGLDLRSPFFDNYNWVVKSIGFAESLDALLDCGADAYQRESKDEYRYHYDELYPFSRVGLSDKPEAIKMFIKHRIHFHDALYWPAHNGYVEVVKLILDAGEDVNKLHYISSTTLPPFDHPHQLTRRIFKPGEEWMRWYGPKGIFNVGTALHAVASVEQHSGDRGQFTGGSTEMIQFLKSRGASLDARDYYGRTPLDVALLTFNQDVDTHGLRLLGATESQIYKHSTRCDPDFEV